MQQLIGSRLRKAREETGLAQGAFAKVLGLSAEYMSLLEAGKRTPSFATLNRISARLNKEISYFFERHEPAFTVLFRAENLEDRVRTQLQKFRRYCEKYLDLEKETGRRLESAPLYSIASAERMADEERRRLGLGIEPIRDIFALCELNGCRIFRQSLPKESKTSGVFVYLEEKNAAFALINAAEPIENQIFTAAHEYGHFLKDRFDSPIIDNPDVFIDEYVSLYPPRELFAQTFAARFLMPPSKIREIVEKHSHSRRIGFEDVLFLKRYFGVSLHAMLRQLRNMNGLRRERFEDYFQRDSGSCEREIFGGPSGGRERRNRGSAIPSDRYKLLAREAAKSREAKSKDNKGVPEETTDAPSLPLRED